MEHRIKNLLYSNLRIKLYRKVRQRSKCPIWRRAKSWWTVPRWADSSSMNRSRWGQFQLKTLLGFYIYHVIWILLIETTSPIDSFFKRNCYLIVSLLFLFSLQSYLILSWFSYRPDFMHETLFLHLFSFFLINSLATSSFYCLHNNVFYAMKTS